MPNNWVMCSLNENTPIVQLNTRKYGRDGAMLYRPGLQSKANNYPPWIFLRSIQPVITVFYPPLTWAEYRYRKICISSGLSVVIMEAGSHRLWLASKVKGWYVHSHNPRRENRDLIGELTNERSESCANQFHQFNHPIILRSPEINDSVIFIVKLFDLCLESNRLDDTSFSSASLHAVITKTI